MPPVCKTYAGIRCLTRRGTTRPTRGRTAKLQRLKMKIRLMSALLCWAIAGVAGAQKSPADVTDAQIRDYKRAAESACVDSGKKRGDPPEKVLAFCKCMTGVFEKNVKRAEWQQAFFYSTQNRGAEEANVLGPHLSKTRVCKPPA